MGRTYTDAEKIFAAELAYLDVHDYPGNITVGEIITQMEAMGANTSKINHLKEYAKEGGITDWENWEIVSVCNDNNDSGYYGMLIKTGDNNAIVASRGSEPVDGQYDKDWLYNDAYFLDGNGTVQEKRAQEFMEEIWYEHGQEFDSFTVTGHSLGGHLAMHQGITAPTEMQAKINNVTSFDGPGFSEEYINDPSHKKDIERMAGKMTHYQYSIVGSLLLPLPGVVPIYLDSTSDGLFDRHSLCNLIINSDGSAKTGDETMWAKYIGELSRFLETIPMEADIALLLLTAILGPSIVGKPLAVIGVVVLLLKPLINVFRDIQELAKKVKDIYENVKYNYFKPKVSGTYEIDIASINSAASDLHILLRDAKKYVSDAKETVNSMSYQWSSCAFLRSKIRANIISIENDISKLNKLQEIMDKSTKRYSTADNNVTTFFEPAYLKG